MAIRPILLLGNPILRARCRKVSPRGIRSRAHAVADLHDTLANFRRRNRFGRGIAAPQIGIEERIVYIDFEYSGPLFNPVITRASRKKFQLWDDCFSFPDLLVKVERHFAVRVEFLNASGVRTVLDAEGALSELLQHEIDHTNGILAIDRAIDAKHLMLRSEYEKLKSQNAKLL